MQAQVNLTPTDDAWADARSRYETTPETLSSIAARLGLHHNALRRQVELRGWQLREPPQKKPSTRSALMRLRDTLQTRLSQFEQHIAELGEKADAVDSEKDARAMNLLVRTLEKVLDLERKHTLQTRKLRQTTKRLDDAARAELVRRIESLAPAGEGEAVC